MTRRAYDQGYDFGYGGEERNPPPNINYKDRHGWLVGWDEGAAKRATDKEREELESTLCEALDIASTTLALLKVYILRKD